MTTMTGRLGRLTAAALMLASTTLPAQTQRPAPATGNRIPALEGDMIVVENDARVKIVRRRQANVRTIFNPEERWLVVLVDSGPAGAPDGGVDMSYSYTGLVGDWPLDTRWEGPATIEDYSIAGEGGLAAMGLVTPRGLVQFIGTPHLDGFRDPTAAAVLTYGGSGRGGVGPNGMSFDEAERRQVEQAQQNSVRQEQRSQSRANLGIESGVVSYPHISAGVLAPPGAPVRVGGTIRQPVKTVDVAAISPERALRAGIQGMVILEITVDAEGGVKNPRILRSIPLLDEAALDAVRQWRYEPTLLNGQPVAVIMTVTVPFQ
jgi:TonB family protein